MSLKSQIFGGVLWSAGGLIIDNGLNFIVKLILARLLFPEDFGIIGLAAVFIGMITIFSDLGMTPALIQRKESNLNEIDYDTAYWAGIGWGVFLAVLLSLVVAPIAADFYNEEILILIIPVLSLNLLFKNLVAVHIVNITREMDFKRITLPRNISNLLSAAISITLALSGFGVWSLVLQSVLSSFFLVFIYSYVSPFTPKLRFSFQSFKSIFGFGVYTTGTNIFNYLTGNVDYLVIGKLLGSQPLGLYTLGYNITYVIRGQIMRVVNSVFYPVYSKVQDDLETAKNYYFKVIRYNALVIYPVMVGLIVLAEPFIIYGIGEKWREAILPMQLMAAAGIVHVLTSSNTVFLRGLGKPKLELIFSIIKTLGVNVPFVVVGVILNGIVGAAGGLLLAKSAIFFINNYTLKKVANITTAAIVKNCWEVFLLASAAVIGSFLIDNYYILGGLFLLYLIIHIWISKPDINQVKKIYKERKNLRSGSNSEDTNSTSI